jgi:hypothetical protein
MVTHLLESNVPPGLILDEPRCIGPDWPPWVVGVKEELGNRQVIWNRVFERFTRYFRHCYLLQESAISGWSVGRGGGALNVVR